MPCGHTQVKHVVYWNIFLLLKASVYKVCGFSLKQVLSGRHSKTDKAYLSHEEKKCFFFKTKKTDHDYGTACIPCPHTNTPHPSHRMTWKNTVHTCTNMIGVYHVRDSVPSCLH